MTIPYQAWDANRGVNRTLAAADVAALGPIAAQVSGGAVDGSPVGGTTPAAGSFTSLAASGPTSLADVSSSGMVAQSVADALVAAGTNRGNSLALTKQINHIATAAASTGVTLPALTPGQICYVFNDGASPVQVYGNGTTTIDGAAAATGVPLTNAKRAIFVCVAANTVISAQLGVVSA